MQKNFLIAYLNGEISSFEFIKVIQKEVEIYKIALSKKGAFVPIKFENDIQIFEITEKHLLKICSDYLSNIFTDIYLCYIVDYLLLSENNYFASEKLFKQFDSLIDSETNNVIDRKKIRLIVDNLKEK